MDPKPITYLMIVQCIRPEIGVMAEFEASTPFPSIQAGGSLELLDCAPRTWDVLSVGNRIVTGSDGSLFCATLILVDSPVVENSGYVVKKRSGEEVGPSETRFGRASIT
jgi:hypothetical protein